MIVTYQYDQVKRGVTRYGKCPTCGKRTRRSQTFVETISPFNKNEFGDPKSYDEAQASVDAKARAWVPTGEFFFEHYTCQDRRLSHEQ